MTLNMKKSLLNVFMTDKYLCRVISAVMKGLCRCYVELWTPDISITWHAFFCYDLFNPRCFPSAFCCLEHFFLSATKHCIVFRLYSPKLLIVFVILPCHSTHRIQLLFAFMGEKEKMQIPWSKALSLSSRDCFFCCLRSNSLNTFGWKSHAWFNFKN